MLRPTAPNPIAYSIPEAAAAVGVSEDTIKRVVAAGDLTKLYPNSKPIIRHDDLDAWVKSLPLTPPSKGA